MDTVFSLIPSSKPTRIPIPRTEGVEPRPVFLMPPETDEDFRRACFRAKTATNTSLSPKKISKDVQARCLAFANRWITGTENCPVEYDPGDGSGPQAIELSDIPDWKKLEIVVPKLIAVGEQFHIKESVDEDELGND